MRKQLLLLIIGIFLICAVFVVRRWSTLHRRGCEPSTVRHYIVSFGWDNGLQRIQVVDQRAGKPEPDPKLRGVAMREATNIASQIIDRTRLEKTEGRFHLSLQGCEQPFLVSWSDPYVSDLGEFMAAATAWDLQTIQEILRRGMNVNAREIGTGRTALIWAATDAVKGVDQAILTKLSRRPDDRTVEFLLEAGADPNAKDVNGTTALMRADSPRAKLLLRHGADANAKDNEGWTPLMYATDLGDIERVKILIDTHADVNASDNKGWTPLMYAASEGKVEKVKLLLAAGADPNAKNKTGDTALSIVPSKRRLTRDDRRVIELLSRTGRLGTRN